MSTDPRTQVQSNGTNFNQRTHNDTYPFIDPTRQNLSGKSVLITGASKGIGRATALSYARAGASNIAIAARSSLSTLTSEIVDAAKKAGRKEPHVVALQVDVTSKDSVAAARDTVSREFGGKLDILINNAGYLEQFKALGEADPDTWWYSYEVNVKGPMLVTHYFLPLLLKGTDKTIIGLSSVGAHLISPGASGYQSAKLALLRLMEFVMAEYGQKGVLAYCVHPGGVPTELALGMPDNMHGLLGDTPELSGDSLMWLTVEKRNWLAGRYVSCQWDMEEFAGKREEVARNDLLKVRMAVA